MECWLGGCTYRAAGVEADFACELLTEHLHATHNLVLLTGADPTWLTGELSRAFRVGASGRVVAHIQPMNTPQPCVVPWTLTPSDRTLRKSLRISADA